MLTHYITSPIRLLLGLPPVYGVTIANRLLQIGRALGIYRGPIHWRARVKVLRIQSSMGT